MTCCFIYPKTELWAATIQQPNVANPARRSTSLDSRRYHFGVPPASVYCRLLTFFRLGEVYST